MALRLGLQSMLLAIMVSNGCSYLSRLPSRSLVSNTGTSTTTKPVKVVIYMESQCPDTLRFLAYQFSPAWDELKGIMDVDMVIYGKATTTKVIRYPNGTTDYQFKCQHGTKECQVNQLMLCGMQALGYDDHRFVPYVLCLQMKSLDQTKICSRKARLDHRKMLTCALGPEGRQLHYQNGIKTKNLRPRLTFVPTTTLDGTKDTKATTQFKTDLCSAYKGTPKPVACMSRRIVLKHN